MKNTDLILKPKVIGGLSKHRYLNSNDEAPYSNQRGGSPAASVNDSLRSSAIKNKSELRPIHSSMNVLPRLSYKLEKSVTDRNDSIHSG
jgi:hypothetical protein